MRFKQVFVALLLVARTSTLGHQPQVVEKPDPPFSIAIQHLLGASGAVIVEIIPGTMGDVGLGSITPAKACIQGTDSSGCYTASVTLTGSSEVWHYGGQTKVETKDLGDGHSIIVLMASTSGASDTARLLALLGADSKGRLVNLLPFVSLTLEDQYLYWISPASSSYGIVTIASYLWGERETHFEDHRYKLSSYEYCPAQGRFVLADQFTTQSKFALERADNDPGAFVLKTEMKQVKRRLAGRRNAIKMSCRKYSIGKQ